MPRIRFSLSYATRMAHTVDCVNRSARCGMTPQLGASMILPPELGASTLLLDGLTPPFQVTLSTLGVAETFDDRSNARAGPRLHIARWIRDSRLYWLSIRRPYYMWISTRLNCVQSCILICACGKEGGSYLPIDLITVPSGLDYGEAQ